MPDQDIRGDEPSPANSSRPEPEADTAEKVAAVLIVALERALAVATSDSPVDRAFRLGVRRAAIELADAVDLHAGLKLLAWSRNAGEAIYA